MCKILKYIFTQHELNIGQRKWLEQIKDYTLTHDYHDSKANKVVDSISRSKKYSLNRVGILPQENSRSLAWK